MNGLPQRRIVAIVGRPNVGKSALFNRLVGRRQAIVHEESGVTRDRLISEARWGDERFDLIDTGGICRLDENALPDAIEAGIQRQVEAALDDAAAVIFVVDVQSGAMPMDLEAARLLRRKGRRVFVAANKADNPRLDAAAVEFEQLGFPVFPVSALHNRGFGELMAEVLKGLPEGDAPSRTPALKVAVAGRPNVGKSSYVNRLLRSDRVIVSSVPGTTRDSIDIPFVIGAGLQARRYVLIDTAGLRAPGKIDTAVERFGRFRAETSIGRADVAVLVLDAVQGPTAQDKKIAELIQDKQKGCVLLVNKWDLQKATQRQCEPAIRRLMPFMGHCPIVFVSSKTGYDIRRSVEVIDRVAAQVSAALPTGLLNRAIIDACRRVHAPAVGGRFLKIFYATQVGDRPVRIRLFVNDPRGVPPAYRDYLIRSLRERFGLEGAPVILQFHARREPRGSPP